MERMRTGLEGQTAALGTLHGKAALIAPALARVGVDVVVEPIDTNEFGTFTGDIARPGPPDQVVVSKATAAARSAGIALGVASEGSFFTHPDHPYLTTNLELVALVDRRNGLVVIGRSQQLAPWAQSMVLGRGELERAVTSFGLPAQAVVLRAVLDVGTEPGGSEVVADLRTSEQLVAAFHRTVVAPDGLARVEPDLRADRCPPRHPGIVAAAEDLANRLMRVCDACGSPGVGLDRVERGRPCAWCGGPTLEVSRRVEVCPGCTCESVSTVGGAADPGSCPVCNP